MFRSMMLGGFLFAACTVTADAQARCDDIRDVRAFHGANAMVFPKFLSMLPSPDTKMLVDGVLQFHQLTADYQVLAFNDASPKLQAWALYCDGRRHIVVNTRFLEELQSLGSRKDEVYWGLVGAIAHEVGHHLRFHPQLTFGSVKALHDAELEADYIMGFTLGMMKASYKEAISSIRELPIAGTDTHPPLNLRQTAIASGWQHATKQLAPTPTAKPRIDDGILSKFDARHSRDIHGHDLVSTDGRAGVPGLTLEECARRCDEDGRCKAFSYDKWNAWCFLKDEVVRSLLDPASLLGVKKPGELPKLSMTAVKKTEFYRNKIFPNQPIASSQVADFKACTTGCETEKRCVAFSFIKATKECRFFSHVDGYYFDQSADSGAIRHIQ